MKKEEIQPWDWDRILFGQAPPEFLIEGLIRCVLIYLLLLVVLRILGKRMDGQLTLTELAVMVTLGAIVAVPMQLPDRGIALGAVALVCVVIFQRGLNWLTVKNSVLEEATQGTMSVLVKNGIMQLREMERATLSKQHVFAMLRNKQIYNLGNVKRLYLEACGLTSVYLEEDPKPELSIYPSSEMNAVKSETHVEDRIACKNCGKVIRRSKNADRCPVCKEKDWMEAVN